MNNKPGDMNDIFKDYEDERMAQVKVEIAAEDAAWDALPQAEKDQITAAKEEAAAKLWDTANEGGDDLDEEEDEDEDDSEEA